MAESKNTSTSKATPTKAKSETTASSDDAPKTDDAPKVEETKDETSDAPETPETPETSDEDTGPLGVGAVISGARRGDNDEMITLEEELIGKRLPRRSSRPVTIVEAPAGARVPKSFVKAVEENTERVEAEAEKRVKAAADERKSRAKKD